MIGKLDPSDRKVTIIGAGFSGLLAAYVLDRRGYEVSLFEKETQAGGMLRTLQTPYGMHETAAHSFLVTPEIREICSDLKIDLLPVREKSRFILREGSMRKFPLKLSETIVAVLRSYFVLADRNLSQGRATLEQWGLRHFGSGVVHFALAPFVTGVYALRPSELTVGAAFPALQVPPGQSFLSQLLYRWRKGDFKKKHPGSQKREMMAPKNGMSSFIEALDQHLTERLGARYKKNSPIDRLPEDCKNIILTTPASVASRLLSNADGTLSKALERVSYASLISVGVVAAKSQFKAIPTGIGVLIPESEKRKALGVLFDSSSFENRVKDESGNLSLTVMLGGSYHPEYLKLGDEEILKIVREELQFLFGFKGQILESVINRWPNAIPRYDSTLMDLWDLAAQGWCSEPGHILFGNYTGQVSLRGMVHTLFSAVEKS